jgi:nucleotide-binding universal stress UspA family protein
MYARLLVPTDGSRGTDRALGLATRFDAHVDALSVVDETFPATSEYDVVVEGKEEGAEAALTAVVEACERAGVSVEPHLRRGRPHEEIVAAVDEYGSDLIVMGTHGRRGLDRIRHLGSVTERVVRTSPVPVLTAPLTVEDRDAVNGGAGEGVSDGAGERVNGGASERVSDGTGAEGGAGEYR